MRRAIAAAALVLALAGRLTAASLFDPAFRFRTLSTGHFRIYFHQGEEPLAGRLSVIAEETWLALQRPLAVRPPALTHVVLVDQTELANGYATPLPYDTIVIYVTWPRGSEFNTDDWLRLVFTHEFTHIVHLDRSESWARAARAVFGRTIFAFPNLFLPTWQIEGLATYEESAITGEGRLHAGEFRAVVDEAARRGMLEPLDRINGGLTDWPGGQGPYAYGLGFHQYLADRFGPETLARLANATARRVPYTSSRVFKRIYGQSLGDLWRDYERSATERESASAADDGSQALTQSGFVVAAPRFDRFACSGCPPEIVYTAQTPDTFPSLRRVALDGSRDRRITRRYYGAATAVGAESLYFDQIEIRRNVATYSDLYEMSRSTGRIRQLTTGARLVDPDLSPDGRTLACVRDGRGARELVLIDLGAPDRPIVLASEPEAQFNAPRWSPDGRRIAVERHRRGEDPAIVVVDVATHDARVVSRAAGANVRFVMPAWRPDGAALVAAMAVGDQPFNIVEIPLGDGGPVRRLTQATGGATWPEVSPDGRTLVFVKYTTAGYDVYAMPYPSNAPIATDVASGASRLTTRDTTGATSASRPYSPLPTLKPTSWTPIVESDVNQVRAGAALAGRDVLGYHAYAVSATWLVSNASAASVPSRAEPDWFVSYAYDRWRPPLFAAVSSTTSFFAGPPTESGAPTAATRRERQLETGAVVPFVHARAAHAAFASFVRASDEYTLADGSLTRDRAAVRASWETSTAHTYGYSISREDGVDAGATVEAVRRALGSSGDATTVTGDFRAYVPGLAAHHVLAARFAAGRTAGDAIAGRTFLLGGASPDASVVDFGSGAMSLLRGFAGNSFAGTRVALLNIDYRWPLARPQRGVGTWPLFLHTVHAAAFADAGHAWTRRFDLSDAKTSIGGELAADIVAGYSFPLTIAAGAAWIRDGSGAIARGGAAYVRLGRAF